MGLIRPADGSLRVFSFFINTMAVELEHTTGFVRSGIFSFSSLCDQSSQATPGRGGVLGSIAVMGLPHAC